MPNLEQVTCSETNGHADQLGDLLATLSSLDQSPHLLDPRGRKRLPRGKKIVVMRSNNSVIFVSSARACAYNEHRMQPVGLPVEVRSVQTKHTR